MSSKPIDYYLEKLNQLPPEVNQILVSMRKYDKEILSLQLQIDVKRQIALSKIMEYQARKSPKLKSQIAEELKSINQIHQQMLKLTAQKITLSDKLYDCIDQATQQMERDLGNIPLKQSQSDLKGSKSKYKRNRKQNEQQILASQPLYCTCKGRAFGKMIKCDNKNCQIQWFHVECIDENQNNFHKQWFCRDCKKNKVKTRNS